MAIATVDAVPARPPAPEPARPRVLFIGTSLAIAASVMAFAGLLGIYLSARSATMATGDPWLPEGATIPLTPANMAMVTLALSVVTMQWAIDAVAHHDRPHAYLALGITALFGVAYLNAMSFQFTQMGLEIRGSEAAVLIYVITGAHMAMVAGAMVFALVMAFRTLGGQYAGRDREGITAAALYWHATVAVFSVIWLAIYVTK
jgi:heme/copper-type cytochrome/quinol oxidase subunit 3